MLERENSESANSSTTEYEREKNYYHPTSDATTTTTSAVVDKSQQASEISDSQPKEPVDSAAAEKQQPAAPPANNHFGNAPNGGIQAWLQVAGAFMIFFNSWGILNTFGVFQTYYESGQLFVETSSNISWIGSIQSYCVLMGGLFSGPIYDRGFLRILLMIGAFGVVFGHMMLSLSHTYWQALLAQGFCVGIGAGFMFVPALAVIPSYFTTKIGLAMGLAACGSSFGGVIYPIVFYRLIDRIGFAWSTRVLGFIALGTCLLPIIVMKQRVKPAKVRAIIDWSAFTDWPYATFIIGATIGFIGLYVFLFYQSYYALAARITDPKLAFYLVPILNAASMFGRTLPNALSDKTGAMNLIIPGALACAVLNYAMIGAHNPGGIIVLVLLFGFFSGVYIALPPVLIVALTQNKAVIGTRIGMGFAFVGFGALAGGPGGGAILGNDEAHLDWVGTWAYGGSACIVSCFIFIALRIWKAGPKLMVKI